jgi:hypothetical protein
MAGLGDLVAVTALQQTGCDVSRAEEGIRFVALKGVRFLMWPRIHGTEELVDGASILECDLIRCGTLGDSRRSGGYGRTPR